MASLAETKVRAYYGPEAVAKAAPKSVLADVRRGMSFGTRNDPMHATTKQMRRKQSRGFRAGAAATSPVGLALEHKGAAAAALGTGAAGTGAGILVARRKKG